jgi:phosphatidylinositol 4-phosphatase
LNSIKKLLEENNFYFSFGNNISQSFHNHSKDDQFIWNYNLYEKDFSNYFIQLIQGFVDIRECKIEKFCFKFAIISRRSRHRAGTRFNKRGIDKNGNVANYVETEQIVETKTDFTSFLIIRGSIPLIWNQKPHMKYEPKVDLNELSTEESKDSFKKHFKNLSKIYGDPIICLDLTKDQGFEGHLKKEYNNQCNDFNEGTVDFISFDVNKICGHSKFEKLSILENQIEKYFGKMKFFSSGNIFNVQNGVFRVNCKDSLDRTNLVETFISKIMIMKQIEHVGGPSKMKEFETDFRYLWSDNGDFISQFYAGTGALRSYFTKTGKSSFMGLLSDGYKSTLRYYLNNMTDGDKQVRK